MRPPIDQAIYDALLPFVEVGATPEQATALADQLANRAGSALERAQVEWPPDYVDAPTDEGPDGLPTPGPWTWRRCMDWSRGRVLRITTDHPGAQMQQQEHVAEVMFSAHGPARMRADARVLAAAPEALGLLREAVALFGFDIETGRMPLGSDWLRQVRELLEKAEPRR